MARFSLLNLPRRSIGLRLFLGHGAVGVLFLVMSSIAIWQISRLTGAVGDLQIARERAVAALQVQQHSTELIAAINHLVTVEDAAVFETEVVTALEALKASHAALDALTAKTASSEIAYPVMTRVCDQIEQVIVLAEGTVSQARAGQWPGARVRMGILLRGQADLAIETEKLVTLSRQMEEASAAQAGAIREVAVLYPVIGLALGMALSAWVTWRIGLSIMRPVKQLTEGAARLADGALDQRVSVESPDELGRLAAAFNQMADRLQAFYAEMEQRVEDRTADLQRRAIQLQTAAEVARDATAVPGLEDLLNRVVNLVRDRFGFYHAGLFLVEERDGARQAVLKAATGEAGRRMLERGHSLKVGEVGIVGYVTGVGQPRIALDVGADAVHFKNPLLPQTRSELAMPLKVGEQIIGALDVQSEQPAAFDENDVIVLQTMADQLAMAIENVRLLHDAQQTMHALAQERNMLSATLNALPDLLFEVDVQGRIYDFRAPRPEWLDRPSEEFRGRTVDQVLPREAASVVREALAQAARTGHHSGALYPLDMPSGRCWFELSIAVKGDPGAPRARFIMLARDVTARVRAEEALGESEERYRTILASIEDGYYEVDLAGNMTFFNDAMCKILGYPEYELMGLNNRQYMSPETARAVYQVFNSVYRTGQPARAADWEMIRKDGTKRFIEASVSLRTDARGVPVGFRGVARDVTERKQAEEMLRQRNRNLILLNRLGQELTALLDLKQVIARLLQAGAEVIGAEDASVWLWDKEQPEYLVCQTILHAHRGSPNGLRLQPGQGVAGWVAQTGQSAVVPYASHDARFFSGIDQQIDFQTVSLLAVPLLVRDKVIGVLEMVNKLDGTFNDDDRVLAETLAASAAIALDNAGLVETLRQQTAELQVRNQELDAFAHTVAHDLKNPLGPIVGFAEVLAQDWATLSPADLQANLQVIARNGRKMGNIIDELLLLASVRKADEIEIRPLDMAHTVAEAQQRLADMIEEYQADVHLPDAWPAALGYEPWIEEVWVNYLSNAIKYGGQPPRLVLGATTLPPGEGEAKGQVRFWVRDNGPGLTLEEQARLFTPFSRLDVRARGHGLGLSIVQRIVERLGGQVGVKSTPGKGSTFWFTLRQP